MNVLHVHQKNQRLTLGGAWTDCRMTNTNNEDFEEYLFLKSQHLACDNTQSIHHFYEDTHHLGLF